MFQCGQTDRTHSINTKIILDIKSVLYQLLTLACWALTQTHLKKLINHCGDQSTLNELMHKYFVSISSIKTPSFVNTVTVLTQSTQSAL
jgi:hypothetical protein